MIDVKYNFLFNIEDLTDNKRLWNCISKYWELCPTIIRNIEAPLTFIVESVKSNIRQNIHFQLFEWKFKIK